MKESFPHDYHARNDSKLQKLFVHHGVCGIGIYWCIVEMLYEKKGRMHMKELEKIAFDLRTDKELVLKVVCDFELFNFEGDSFSANRVKNRLKDQEKKSELAREKAKKRWRNPLKKKRVNATALKIDATALSAIKNKELMLQHENPMLQHRKLMLQHELFENKEDPNATVVATEKKPQKDTIDPLIKEKEIFKEKEKIKNLRNIIPPPKNELVKYIQEHNYPVDPAMFYNFYESKGWKIGKERMIDWQAAVRTWVQKRKSETPGESIPPPPPRKDVSTTDAEARGILEHLKGKRVGKE